MIYKKINSNLKLPHLNERIIELIDIAPKDFWGAQDTHLETIKKYYPKLKIVARGTTLKAFGEKEVLDEFEKRFQRLMVHFSRYNNIDNNVIERVILGDVQEDKKFQGQDKILVHGVGGKIIKAMTLNQQLLVDTMEKNDMVFAVGPAGTGKTYTGVAMAIKALKEKQVKRIILTRPAAWAKLCSVTAGDPPVTCSMHGRVRPPSTRLKLPLASVVPVSGVPVAHLAVTAALAMPAPVAASPLNVGAATDAVPPPPPPGCVPVSRISSGTCRRVRRRVRARSGCRCRRRRSAAR